MIPTRFARCLRLALLLIMVAAFVGLPGGCGPGEGEDPSATREMPGPADLTNSKVKAKKK